jgi:dTDP-4-amino-4,6-dideoxygalactose transaminase
MDIPFVDFRREYRDLKKEIFLAINRVIASGHYILGKEVEDFEQAFARYIGVKYAVGVGNGTEALHLSLLACGIKPGDEVVTATNTCAPTVSAIMHSGAIPVLVDADPLSYCLDVSQAAKKITKKTRVIMPVHLYGQTADMGLLIRLAEKYNLKIIEDCAQAHGAKYKNKMAGSFGSSGCFSFYPTKNLGALGDGGMIITDSKEISGKCRLLRNYGQKKRYEHDFLGFNSRLDELHAAILKVKLGRLDEWNKRRREIAAEYKSGIDNPHIVLPAQMGYAYHVYHLFVARVKSRDYFQDFLGKNGIQTLIHYPIPMHKQKFLPGPAGSGKSFPIAEELAKEIVSLPLYPYLTKKETGYIIKIINSYQPGK